MNTHSRRPPKVDRRLAAFDRNLHQIIRTHGWAIINVPLPVSRSYVHFAYTVGLTERRQPELCVTGLPAETANSILDELARRTTTGGDPFDHGQRLSDVIDGYDAIIIEGPANGPLLQPTIALSRYHRRNIHLQQCVWPDPQGLFPWQDGYSTPNAHQPTIATLT